MNQTLAIAPQEPLSKQLTIVIGLTVVGLMGFGFAVSFYRTVLFEETLTQMEQENRAIAERIDLGNKDLQYYQSQRFKDAFAKQNLGRVLPGEKTLLLPPKSPSDTAGAGELAEGQKAAFTEVIRQMPVIEHWKLYFFHKDALEQLRKELK
jgi:hypothetical protein